MIPTIASEPATTVSTSVPVFTKPTVASSTVPALPETPEPTTAPTTTSAPVPVPASTTPAAPSTPDAPPAAIAVASFPPCDGPDDALLAAVNVDRQANGLKELCSNAQLTEWAQSWANWMAEHQEFTHQDLQSRITESEFSKLGENILRGPGDLSVVAMEAAWMNSPGHRAHVVDPVYAAAGIGIAHDSNGVVWAVVDFGG